uniref:Uncharacterized protein n=1 Tax=Siphoviridae sp. ctI8Q15 TaxID=2827832 RepID=A0A8S5SEP2_9CAUD|nr:MAG TPA: hypothetical protein [Siphoviridae sp. ctI8Q15]DAT76813.1 MAG TPA: hypothetical protein [Caudoviricetes sp.]
MWRVRHLVFMMFYLDYRFVCCVTASKRVFG